MKKIKYIHKFFIVLTPLLIANQCPPSSSGTASSVTRQTGNLTRSPMTGNFRIPSSNQVNRYLDETLSSPSGCGETRHVPTSASSQPSGDYPVRNYTYSLKNYPAPSRGCIPVATVSLQESRRLMASQNLTTEGATESEERALGAAIKRVQQLNGGPLREGMGTTSGPYPFRFRNANGSGQRADHILIGRGNHDHGNSVAQHAHEWAHLIGNNGAYSAFRAAMGSGRRNYCMVSNYADDNNNEQFAEVFAAFVTEPSILLNNTRTPGKCRQAFEFFRNWFGNGSRVNDCL